MTFDSLLFLFRFLPVFLICYYVVPQGMKNLVLFLGSLVFYAWGEPYYALLLVFLILVHYVLGLLIEATHRIHEKRAFVIVSVLLNVGFMLGFRYADALIEASNEWLGSDYTALGLEAPIGLMIYSLCAISYVVDVYRGDAKAQHNPLQLAVYLAFFPRLLAGPIDCYCDTGRYLKERHVDLAAISSGLRRFIVGLAKKVLLADELFLLWEECLSSATGDVLGAWLGIFAYAFALYFTLSGYSDMAIGLGNLMGFRFRENFRHPYVADSIKDFWRRWYVSMGEWFHSYVYIPMGGNQYGVIKQLINVIFVWLLIGFWQGGSINLLLWGLWYALLLLLDKFFLGKVMELLPGILRQILTFLAVLIGWVFFAFESPLDMLSYLGMLFGVGASSIAGREALFLGREYFLVLVIAVVASLPLANHLTARLSVSKTGPAMALYRVGEKLIPSLLLLLSIASIVGGGGIHG